MRGKDLLEKLELVDSEYIQAASIPLRKKKKRIMSKIAAAIVIFLGISIIIRMNYTNINISTSPNTSDKYSSLTDMLNYLGANDKHKQTRGVKSISTNINGADEMHISVMYKDCIYHFNSYIDKYSSGIQVFSLKENKLLKNVNTISSQTTLKELDIHPDNYGMFIYQNNLILLRSVGSYDDLKTSVNIYSLDDPETPQIKREYLQSGQLETAFISDNKLYLFTSDGMCACGFSAKSDTDDYKPYLTFDEKEIKWNDNEINILGEPKRVFYSAVSVMDLQNNEISEKKAFYGDIQEIFFDENTISFYIKDSLDDFDKPNIYIFDMSDNFSCISKINIDKSGVTNILDIKKSGDNYNIICQHYSGIMYYWSSEILAISADTKNNTLNYQTFKPDSANAVIDDIVWDDGKAIITVSQSSTAKFVIAKFDNGRVSFKNTSLWVDRVAGIDGHEYFNSPFRSIKSMIPIGNNLYLRYNRKPDGFDIIDFSDEPKYVYKSQGELPSDCRFNYRYTWYENELLHTVAIIPDNSKGSNGKTLSEVYVYSVDTQSASPFTLIEKSSPIKRNGKLNGIFHGDLTIFQYNGKQLYINNETHSLEILE